MVFPNDDLTTVGGSIESNDSWAEGSESPPTLSIPGVSVPDAGNGDRLASGGGGPERIRVLIAEDEAVLRKALTDLIEAEPGFELVGTASDAEEAVELARRDRPDVALVDVKMPGGGGPRAARDIRQVAPQTRVVALSAYEDRRTVLEMLRSGVVGYIVKGTATEQIVETVKRTARGQGSLSVEVTADVIHELVRLLERSESLARELQELNRTKSELIQLLSHELFTPITVIQGFALTVADRGSDLQPDEVRVLSSGVSRASERIRRLVGNLGVAARLDREGVEIPTRPVPAGDILDSASAEFAHHRGQIRLPSPDDVLGVKLWADRDLAVQALVIVMENALDLSPEGEVVEVEMRPGPAEVEFAVLDRGPGVPEGWEQRIFQAFSQIDTSNTRTHQGLGIGLHLARRIMEAHRGDVHFTHRPGGGSVFVLSFPSLQRLGETA